MHHRSRITIALASSALAFSLAACARSTAGGDAEATGGALPLKRAPRPTTAAITPSDLMTRLYIFADDSMEGRRAGSPGSTRANAYIERELRRLGLQPAGENGSYYQDVPLVTRRYDATATLAADGGVALKYGTDFIATIGRGTPRTVEGAQVVYGGTWAGADQLTAEQMAGRFVIFAGSAQAPGFQGFPRLAGTPYAGAGCRARRSRCAPAPRPRRRTCR
jgi:hypothetical protein